MYINHYVCYNITYKCMFMYVHISLKENVAIPER